VLEMGICFSLLMALTFGTIEFGDAFFKKNTLQGAAREGARLAITAGATKSSIEAAVTAVMNAAGVAANKYTIQITNTDDTVIDPATAVAGTAIKVSVTATWGQIGLRPMGILNASKSITGVAVMRKES
jgi:Flp pilus assembly protein TadG